MRIIIVETNTTGDVILTVPEGAPNHSQGAFELAFEGFKATPDAQGCVTVDDRHKFDFIKH